MKNIKLLILIFFVGIFSIFAQEKRFITYTVLEGETIQSIAKKISATPYDILKLNPDIEKNVKANDIIIIPNKAYNPALDISSADLSEINARDIIVDGIIYHEIIAKETLYSILQKYNVTKEQMNQLNPFLVSDGLKLGQVVKIPIDIDAQKNLERAENYQPYLVKPKETKYSISREYGISVAQLEELNPKIKINGLQIDDVILVPKNASNNLGAYSEHKVENKETFYGLTKRFNISKEELLAANPDLKDGVKEGMLLKIPNKVTINTDLLDDTIVVGTKINVAMMLPFRTKLDTLNFEKDRLLHIATDFYFGALLAIDSLKNQGLSLDVKVYDTENNEVVSQRISNKTDFDNNDVVIGPMYFNNVRAVAKNLHTKKPLIISPLSARDHSVILNNNLVQEVPTQEHMALEMLQFIKSNYINQKIIVIVDDQSKTNFSSWIKEIESLDSLKNVTIIKPIKGYIKPDIFKKSLGQNIENWVLLFGSSDVFVADVVNNLGVLPEANKITLFAFDKGKSFDKIDNNFLARVNFHFPSTTYYDDKSIDFQNFTQRYEKVYATYPSEFAMNGFDVTYDILMRLATGTNLIGQGVSQRLSSKYSYIENTSKGILNKGIFIVKYEGLTLKKVN